VTFPRRGDLCFVLGSSPRLVINAPSSSNFASSSRLTSRVWSTACCAELFSNSCCSLMICSRSPRFSVRSRDVSFSRFRIRSDCVELARAISRFWRINLRFTAIWSALLMSGIAGRPYKTRWFLSKLVARSSAPFVGSMRQEQYLDNLRLRTMSVCGLWSVKQCQLYVTCMNEN